MSFLLVLILVYLKDISATNVTKCNDGVCPCDEIKISRNVSINITVENTCIPNNTDVCEKIMNCTEVLNNTMTIISNNSIIIEGTVHITGNSTVVFVSLWGNITVNSSEPVKIQRGHTSSNRVCCITPEVCECDKQRRFICKREHAAIEFKALKGKILIASRIIANGTEPNVSNRTNGSCYYRAGGSITLSADQVEITGNGSLIADGDYRVSNNSTSCSGGHGGVVNITAKTLRLYVNVISVKGWPRECQERNGFIFINILMTSKEVCEWHDDCADNRTMMFYTNQSTFPSKEELWEGSNHTYMMQPCSSCPTNSLNWTLYTEIILRQDTNISFCTPNPKRCNHNLCGCTTNLLAWMQNIVIEMKQSNYSFCVPNPKQCNKLLTTAVTMVDDMFSRKNDVKAMDMLVTFSEFVSILMQDKGFAPGRFDEKLKNINFTVHNGIINDKLEAAIKKDNLQISLKMFETNYGCKPNCNATVFIALMNISYAEKMIKQKEDKDVSLVVLVDVVIGRKPLKNLTTEPAVVRIPYNGQKKDLKCRYLKKNKRWCDKGVSYINMKGDNVGCKTEHLTNFAMFLQKNEPDEAHKLALTLISYIGCALSLTSVIITLILYVFLRKDMPMLSEDRNIVHINLMISLGLVEVFFLAGLAVTPNTLVCQVIAVILHYLFLTSFFWMLNEGIILYLKVVMVFNGENLRMWKFILLGWGLPAVFVAVFASLIKLDEYTAANWCFLSTLTNVVWALLGPAAFTMAVNFGILIAVLHVLIKMPKDDIRKSKTLIAFRGLLMLAPILGFTWVFALVAINHDSLLWQYAFCISNSFQGFMIFLIYGIGNSQIRTTLKRKYIHPDKWNDVKPKFNGSYGNESEEKKA